MAEVVRFADIKQRVLATQAKLNAASQEGREINARLLSLLEIVEKTLLYHHRKIFRLRRMGKALAVFGLLGWFTAAALVVEKMHVAGLNDGLNDGPTDALGGAVALAGRDEPGPASREPRGRDPGNDGKLPSSEISVDLRGADRAAMGAPPPPMDTQLAAVGPDKLPDVDTLVTEPKDYQGRDVEVTGSVVRIFKRYRLRSETGANTLVIDIDRIQPSDRAKLEAAVEEASLLTPVRARIKGKVERKSSGMFHLVASNLVLLDPPFRPRNPEHDGQG